ncbi:response regulator transcription factor [Ferrimonas lipolytica]|uniref:Response regulator transcription factor n=1 Tax=Ferrimonas lipolytica TaxID=2724191 RepID=A0A6H1UEV2_9GAMM|nr:response regulator [Ferrimonas lipolytica]QIZ77611.1 response regulator transcription factor [Ferrimonas lipolytica]
MTEPLQVILVDDDPAVLNSLEFMLTSYQLAVTPYLSGADFLAQTDLSQPGCVVLDSRMPGMTGQQLHQQMIEVNSPLSVVFLTGHGDVPMAVEAFKQGACDFFQKPVAGKVLYDAVVTAHAASVTRHQSQCDQRKLAALTEREQQILARVLQNQTNKQMAAELFVSVRTIEVQRATMMRKLEAENLLDLYRLSKC